MVTIYLTLLENCTSTKKPIYDVLINGNKVFETNRNIIDNYQSEIFYKIKENFISYIEIILKNKEGSDTIIKGNQITEDLYLVVKSLSIDNIDFTTKLSKISNYKDTDGNIHNTHGWLSFNGTFKVKFHKNVLFTNWLASLI